MVAVSSAMHAPDDHLARAMQRDEERAQPRLLSWPVVGVEPIDDDDANRLLVRWGHKLGPCNRPFDMQSWALEVDAEPISVAITASIVHGPVARTEARPNGYALRECIELARLASSTRWANRVMLRVWREVLAHRWPHWPVSAAVSYSKNALHSGNLYRFDGWEKVRDDAGHPPGRSSTWSKQQPTDAAAGPKTLWLYRYDQAAP